MKYNSTNQLIFIILYHISKNPKQLLNVFTKMVEDSYNADYIPEPNHVKRLFERSSELAMTMDNEVDWYNAITQEALSWLS